MSIKRGFTLLEVMVVIAIVGILAAVAVPSLWSAIQAQRHVAAGMTVKTALENASAIVKKSRNDASVYIKGNKITTYQGCANCVTTCTATNIPHTAIDGDSLGGRITIYPLATTTAPVTGFSPNTNTFQTIVPADSGWKNINNGVCVNFIWGKIGNSVKTPGWLSLRDSTQDYGIMIIKTPTDDRFQVWFFNQSTWSKKSP